MKKYVVNLIHKDAIESIKEITQNFKYLPSMEMCIVECTDDEIHRINQLQEVLGYGKSETCFGVPCYTKNNLTEANNWALKDVSNTVSQNIYKYCYTGKGVDIVVSDTGVIPHHEDFKKGADYDNPDKEDITSIDLDFQGITVNKDTKGWWIPQGIQQPDEDSRVLVMLPVYMNYSGIDYGYQIVQDAGYHGTAVASCAAGLSCGCAFNSRIIAMHYMHSIEGYVSGIQNVIDFHNLKKTLGINRPTIVNQSFYMATSTAEESAIVKYATQQLPENGIILISSAGNEGCLVNYDRTDRAPAGAPNIISVGASDNNGNLAYFSSYGNKISLFAPGILGKAASYYKGSPLPTISQLILHPENYTNRYLNFSGTSMASPFVTGVVACALESLGNPMYSNVDDVIGFIDFFIQEHTRSWTAQKHFIAYTEGVPTSQESRDNPDNWVDGLWPDDNGSPSLTLDWCGKIRQNGQSEMLVPATEGIQCVFDNTDVTAKVENSALSVLVNDEKIMAVTENGSFCVDSERYNISRDSE